jgi:excisionase family DNA binding protein
VAELLGVHENWVYDQAAGGALPSYKIGGTRRFDPDELKAWIAERRGASRKQPKTRRVSTKKPRPKALRYQDDGQPRLFE